MKYVIKRDGIKKRFDESKIEDVLIKATEGTATSMTIEQLSKIKKMILEKIDEYGEKNNVNEIDVESVQDIVVESLEKANFKPLAKAYTIYRNERNKRREEGSDLMKTIKRIGVETDRDNANVGNNFSAKLLRIASEANKWHILLSLLPKEMARAHETGDIHIHDLDSYNLTTNCLHIPTSKVLKNGFNTGYGTIKSPKRIEVAAELLCIVLQATQNDMFGGQSHPNFDNDLAEYVGYTRKEIEKEYSALGLKGEELRKKVEFKLISRVRQAMQAVVYNLNTMHSRAGSQVPFSSLNIGIPKNDDAALVCQAFLEEYYKGLGNGEQPIFPNIIFRVKKGVNEQQTDKYYYLFQLACHVAALRMNPTFMNIDADFNKEYYDKGYLPATMGCRTYLMSNINGDPGVEGRGNNAPVTINMVRLAILAKQDINKFFELFDEKITLCENQLLHRYETLKKLKVRDLPFVAGQKLMLGSEKLDSNDSIDSIMKNGTWGIGFIGLAETLKLLIGKHHGESIEAQELGIRIVTHLRERCNEMTKKHKLNFSCYATPAEGLSGRFIKFDSKTFGKIKWITDKGYYTNSFHVPVDYPISIAEKIKIEAPYHKLCNGGHISYVEFDDYPTGEQVEKIVRYAYENTNINYIGINFHIRYCKDCAKRIEEMKKARSCNRDC